VSRGSAPPGYRDAHTHLSAGACDLLDLDLRAVRTQVELDAAVADAVASAPSGAWVRGFGWDGVTPPRDPAASAPIFLARRDGHAAWVNAAGRAALGLDREGAVVSEGDFDAARARLPERSMAERLSAMRERLAEAQRHGIDEIDDMVERWAPEAYARLRDAGELTVAVGMWLPEDLADTEAEAIRRAFPHDDPRIAVRGIKIFLDGTLEARTAALSTPYADSPETSGSLRMEAREVPARVGRWAERGWPVALHAIGDLAVTVGLDALAAVPRSPRGAHRIEHAQVVRRADLHRFASAGVIASVQPGHWRDDLPFLESRLGARADVVIHPLAAFVRSGAKILLGSDWPVSGWDPVAILGAAADPARGGEALGPAAARAWYTSGPR
jgi:predicted amidohydrolase YtcJ